MPTITFKKALLKIYRIIASPRIIRQDRLIISDSTDACDSPIFLIGLHRSGTTLLRQIVDSHSNIACPPETYFLTAFSKTIEYDNFLTGLNNMGFGRDAAVFALRQCASSLYDTYRQSKGKPRWADKTPHYIMILPFLDELYGPQCQYVMIYRHPFDVCESLLQKRWSFIQYHKDPFLNVLLYIRDGLERQIKFAESHESRCFVVHYEELMESTAEVLKSMFQFLKEPWEPQVIEYGDFQHDVGTGDAEAMMLKGLRPSVGNWKRRWSSSQVALASETLEAQLVRLSYTTDL